ncbi:MAG TPA: TIGR03085 family metal-binding protein [Pseudonocardiaceae bacterium]|nr:TIGR03085 family metal-binding protein [Pseudonocardiaceae bacterium]
MELPEAMEGLVDLYRSISGGHPDWNDLPHGMERAQRVLLQSELISAGLDRKDDVTMGGSTVAADERRALCDLMEQVGPDAPTLCEGWTTRDLAAHLVVRESRLDVAGGILLPPLARYTDRVQSSIAQRPWTELVDQIRSGPPWWSPWRLPKVGDMGNTMEFFVHHEDVRRARTGWKPRSADSRRAGVLWGLLRSARVLYRNSPVGVVLRLPDGFERTARRGERTVTVVGCPEELTLHAFGRDQAIVEIEGDQVAVAALQSSQRGL